MSALIFGFFFTFFYCACDIGEPRARALHDGAECEVPRFPLRHPVRPAIRDVRVSRRLFKRGRSTEMEVSLRSQSGGRRNRWLPLVFAGGAKPSLHAELLSESYNHCSLALARHLVFPQDRTHFR